MLAEVIKTMKNSKKYLRVGAVVTLGREGGVMTGMQHMEESEKELGGGERVFISLNFLPCLHVLEQKKGVFFFLKKMNQTRFLREVSV